MSIFAIHCLDKPASLELRLANREAHLAYAGGFKAHIKLGGPLLGEDGGMIGSMLIMEFDDIEQARAERAARQQVAGAASAGMEAFKARFQQSQDMAAKIEAERARLAAEAQQVAQERAAEQAAQERAAKAPKHAALSNDGPTNTKGRSGPGFSM